MSSRPCYKYSTDPTHGRDSNDWKEVVLKVTKKKNSDSPPASPSPIMQNHVLMTQTKLPFLPKNMELLRKTQKKQSPLLLCTHIGTTQIDQENHPIAKTVPSAEEHTNDNNTISPTQPMALQTLQPDPQKKRIIADTHTGHTENKTVRITTQSADEQQDQDTDRNYIIFKKNDNEMLPNHATQQKEHDQLLYTTDHQLTRKPHKHISYSHQMSQLCWW